MQTKSSRSGTLLELLVELCPESSKNTLRSWISDGRVSIDEAIATKANTPIEEGQSIQIGTRKKHLPKGLRVVFEDADLIVVDKPEGLLSVATDQGTDPSVHVILKRVYSKKRIYPVHRLDRDTSGLLLFAKNEKTWKELKRALEKREIKREYRALVQGNPGEGTWKSYLRETATLFVEPCHPTQGKEAITHFETLKSRDGLSLVAFQLETGRKHQIRVQAKVAGFPILGDKKYRGNQAKRMYLHAAGISFTHPKTGKELSFASPVSWI